MRFQVKTVKNTNFKIETIPGKSEKAESGLPADGPYDRSLETLLLCQ